MMFKVVHQRSAPVAVLTTVVCLTRVYIAFLSTLSTDAYHHLADTGRLYQETFTKRTYKLAIYMYMETQQIHTVQYKVLVWQIKNKYTTSIYKINLTQKRDHP